MKVGNKVITAIARFIYDRLPDKPEDQTIEISNEHTLFIHWRSNTQSPILMVIVSDHNCNDPSIVYYAKSHLSLF